MGDTRVRRLGLAAVALFVLSLVGLATVEPDHPGGVFVSASAATKEQGTAAFTLTLTTRTFGAPLVNKGEGRIDFDSGNGTVTFTTPPSEMIVHDGISYTRTGGTGKWIAVDAHRLGRRMPMLSVGGGATDPLAMLDALQQAGVATNVRREPGDAVRGVATTRLTADIDAERLAAKKSERDMLRALQVQVFRYQVWVDADDVVRRVSVAVQAASMAVDVAMELYDFGVPVTVVPPPPDQVYRMPTP